MTEMTMSQEINALKDHVEARFASLERWLERVTTAVERHGENRERLVILETRFEALEGRIASHERDVSVAIERLSVKVSSANELLVKFGVYFAIGGAVMTVIVPIILKKFVGV